MQKEYIETERLILRKFREDDALPMYINWASDPEVSKYLLWDTHKSVEETHRIIDIWLKDYEKEDTVRYCMTIKGNDEPIGSIDVVNVKNGLPEIGYCMMKKYWNQGIMTEAVKGLIHYLFDNGYKQVCVCAFVDNIGSNRVIQKCGGQYIKQFEHDIKGKKQLVNYYIISKDNL